MKPSPARPPPTGKPEPFPPGYPKARLPSLTRRVKEACAGVLAVGGTVVSVKISAEGAVEVLTAAGQESADAPAANEWDEVLPR